MIVSCTEVDIHIEDTHTHLPELKLIYDMSDFKDTTTAKVELPDSLIVVAYRVINTWKCTYLSPVADSDAYGKYLFNNPKKENDTTTTETPSEAKDEIFKVKQGFYRFIAFNEIIDDEVYEDNTNEFWYLTPGVIDSIISNKKISIHYKSHNLKKELLKKYGRNWVDFNPYSTYISSKKSPMLFQFTDVYTIDYDKTNTVNIKFKDINQKIEIRFAIDHREVSIDSMVAEISGIPCGINLMTGEYDFSHTYKTLVDMVPVTASGDMFNGITEYAGNIDVLALAANISERQTTGSGIMQLALFTHTLDEEGKTKKKVFHVGINLYNTIKEIAPVIGGREEKVVLDVEKILQIDKDEILKDKEDGSTLDIWKEYANINVDV